MSSVKFVIVVALLALSACKKAGKEEAYVLQFTKVRNAYMNTRRELMNDSKIHIQDFTNAITQLYYQVSQVNLDAAKGRYLDSRYYITIMGPYLYGNGSLTLPNQDGLNRFENFPINPAYLDYTTAGTGGIINEANNYPIISEGTIKNWNLQNGLTNYSCGIHVLEFLLYGEDTSATLPGNRPVSDFDNVRRKQYLQYTANILDSDFDAMLNQNTLQQSIYVQEPSETFAFIMDGLLTFIKLDFAENSLKRSLITMNDQYEIDRFSDNSMADLKTKVKAIRLFLDGRDYFDQSNDYFLIDFIQEVDPSLLAAIQDELNSMDSDLNAVTVSFEEALVQPVYFQKLNNVYLTLNTMHQQLLTFKNKVLGN